MQPSELEIQREVETLRDIRRRSTAQGGILDPDLPAVSGDSSSSTGYWDDSSSSSHGDESENGSESGDDPFHLFWVPARLHPEIAPAEFRAFLKEHARGPADGAALGRSSSLGSSALGRKKSMLSRQYDPSDKDSAEDEKVMPVRRNRASVFTNPGPQLTISDLQKLEELAEEASESHDPTRLRSVLRRSLSLNVAPSVIDQMDDMPDLGDDADSPIIVPRPGQILRRAARTKIRKPGTGEGPHRFTTTRSRRGSATRSATTGGESRTSSDFSSSDHGDEPMRRKRADSDIPELSISLRPESYSEEVSIYDAYTREDSEESEQHAASTTEYPSVSPPPPLVPDAQEESSPVALVLHHPQPQRVLSPPSSEESLTSPTLKVVSPPPVVEASQARPPLVQTPSLYQPPSLSPSPSPSDHRKEKDKKGLFGKWGGDKGSKKVNKDHKDQHHNQREKEKEKEREKEKEKEKEKESGFFGSLFGGKKKQDEPSAPPTGGIGNSGRETAAALLGTSKSAKAYAPSPSPQPIQGYARYPIHVERAIYRLSHIKLANPRRPLYEQVLISNLMFWYLGVINKTQAQPQPVAAATSGNGNADKETEQAEQKEREEREKAEMERVEKEKEREKAEQKRRGSMTKNPTLGTPGARKAEMPVRGPQYDMQHRAMEQEYNYQAGNSMGRTSSAPPTAMNYQQQPSTRTSGGAPAPYPSVQLVQPQPQIANNRYYTPPAPQLPPGAMPPLAVEQTWMNTSQTPPMSRNHTSPSPPRSTSPQSHNASDPRRARSPPAGQRYTPAQEKQPWSGPGRSPGRSLSATAMAPIPQNVQLNGKLRKGSSAHAVMPHQRASEEEDVPLAVYQPRRK